MFPMIVPARALSLWVALFAFCGPANAAAVAEHTFYRGKTVVLTGADGGIGQALTRALVGRGAQVLAGVRDEPVSAELEAMKKSAGTALTIAKVDVTDANSVIAFRARAPFDHLDVLINTAGINIDERKRILELPEERIQATFNVNASGPVRVTQAFYPLLQRGQRPTVANISSIMGSIGDNRIAGSAAYRMSKAALNMFGKSLAIEQPDLLVLSLHPGWVKTTMGGKKAEIDVETSATGILRVIARAKPAQSGRFYRYTGEPAPW